MKHKRGDLSHCRTKRFWAYRSYNKPDGTRAERWIPTHMYEGFRETQLERQALSEAKSDYRRRVSEALQPLRGLPNSPETRDRVREAITNAVKPKQR